MHKSASALEYFKRAIRQERSLAEGLAPVMVEASVVELDGLDGVSKSGFFARPSQT